MLGVDGGNTKTVALVADETGRIVGYGRGGCADISAGPTEAPALAEIERAATAALTMSRAALDRVAVRYYCLAGADWPDDYEFLEESLSRTSGASRVIVANDALGALRAGSPDGTGVVVTCGTGVAAAARNAEGDYWHTGFWAEPLCGVELGRRALRAVYRAELGIDPPTRLTQAVLTAFGRTDVESLLRGLEGRQATRPSTRKLSQLAPLLLDAAADGDQLAIRIVTEHGALLAEYAKAAARRVGLDASRCTLVLNGGIFRHRSSIMRSSVLEALGRDAHSEPASASHEPAVGALLLALEEHGVEVDDRVMHAIEASLPPTELYAS